MKKLYPIILSLLLCLAPGLLPAAASAAPINLVSNPSIEAGGTNTATDWSQGRWGTNTVQFTVPTNGHTGSRSLQVNVSGYSSGDAKWYFKPVAVQPNTQYSFSDFYKATVNTELTAQVTDTSGGTSYIGLGSVSASSTWQQANSTFTTPANASTVTVFHAIAAKGTLQTDDFSFSTTAAPTPTPNPTGNIVPNASVETVDPANTSRPQSWTNNSWGSNTSKFSYPTTGHTGSRSVRTQITRYTNGDAKWNFSPQPVTGGATYTFSDYYQSTAATDVGASFTLSGGGTQYVYIGGAPASSGWSKYERQFSAPANATAVTVLHALVGVGTLTVDDYSITPYTTAGFANPLVSLTFDDAWRDTYENGLPILQQYGFKSTFYLLTGPVADPVYMTPAMMLNLKNAGYEIASHTVDHPELPLLTAAEVDYQLQASQASLRSWTGAPVTNFATPYGEYNDAIITNIKKYYRSHRSVDVGYNAKSNFNIYNLKVQNIVATTTSQEVAQWVAQAKADKTWLILVYHRVNPDTSVGQYNTTPAALTSHLTAIRDSGVPVVTVEQALDQVVPQL